MALRSILLALVLTMKAQGGFAQTLDIQITYIERDIPPPPTLSNLDPRPADEGLMGARLAIADSNTTGKFLNHSYSLNEVVLEEDEALGSGLAADAGGLMVVNSTASDLLALADLERSAKCAHHQCRFGRQWFENGGLQGQSAPHPAQPCDACRCTFDVLALEELVQMVLDRGLPSRRCFVGSVFEAVRA